MKKYPVLYDNKEDCSGCAACYAVCSNQAIEMVEDEEGFLYPYINRMKCVQCNLCLKVCPFKS